MMKQINNSSTFYLIGILALAACARLLWLAQIPNGFYADEASTGYDAFSLLVTGKDQYGAFLPFFARSFGDYNESLYRFFAVIPVRLFGLSEFSVRLPAAVIGTGTIFVLYLLVNELFQNKRIALAAALLLAINPWHIQFSRVAFRSILFPFFFLLGLFFFLRGIKNPKNLLLALPIFALTLYTYAAARVFMPLFLIFLIILYWRELWEAKGYAIFSFGIFLIIFFAFTWFWVSPEGMARADSLLILNPAEILQNYITYFDLQFLFLKGDRIIRHSPLNVGQLHHFELITFSVGFFILIKDRNRRSFLLLVWLLLYPLPAALTSHAHALRAIIGSPLFPIVSSLGLVTLLEFLQNKKRFIGVGFVCALIIGNCLFYAKVFYIDYPQYSARSWQYGLREAITLSTQEAYEQIYISDTFFMPHIFVLFYTQFPPTEYQQEPLLTLSQTDHSYTDFSIGNYLITSMPNLDELNLEGALIITPSREAKKIKKFQSCNQVKIISTPDGQDAIHLLECDQIQAN